METIRISAELNIDLAPDGTVYGIELLNANEQLALGADGKLVLVDEARDIRIIMDGEPLDEHPAVHSRVKIPEVGEPGSEISCRVATFDSPPFEIETLWEDASGVPGRYRATLMP